MTKLHYRDEVPFDSLTDVGINKAPYDMKKLQDTMRFCLEAAGFEAPFYTLCDHTFVTTVLWQLSQEHILERLQNALGGDFVLGITPCTVWSLLKATGLLPRDFFIERCVHNPPVSSMECVLNVALNAEASQLVLATSSNEVLSKTIRSHCLPVLYATTKNNIRLIPPTYCSDCDSSAEEDEYSTQKIMARKRKLQAKKNKRVRKHY